MHAFQAIRNQLAEKLSSRPSPHQPGGGHNQAAAATQDGARDSRRELNSDVSDQHDGWRNELMFAGSLTIAGDAFHATFFPMPVPPADEWKAAQARIDPSCRKDIGKKIRKKLGSTYAVQANLQDPQKLKLRVVANEDYKASVGFTSGPVPWVAKVDHVVEEIRRYLQDKLQTECSSGTTLTADWRKGNGVYLTDRSLGPEAPDRIVRDRLRDLRKRETEVESRRRMIAGVSIGAALLGGILSVFLGDVLYAVLFAIYIVPILAGTLIAGGQVLAGVRAERRELNEQLDLRELLEPDERRAQRLFQIHSLELKRYYDQALRQRAYIFWIGLVCILGGFGAVVAAFWILRDQPNADIDQKILATILGAVGAVLANFIAVVYLRMFSQTVQSMATFHNRLVVTHHAYFGNFLATRIGDKALQHETLADMAAALVRHQEGTLTQQAKGEQDSGPATGASKATGRKR